MAKLGLSGIMQGVQRIEESLTDGIKAAGESVLELQTRASGTTATAWLWLVPLGLIFAP